MLTPERKRYIRGWMRKGYRWAAKAYKGINRSTLKSLFNEIRDEAEKYLRHAELGDILTVSVWADGIQHRVKVEHLKYHENEETAWM